MDRAQKAEVVENLTGVFAESGSVVVAHYTGMTVAELTKFRSELRAAGATFKIAKNRLAKRALQEGRGPAKLADLFTGPTGIAYAKDPVAAPKISAKYAKENDKLVILGGALGEVFMSADAVKALADLPSIDVLRAKLIGLIQAPATKIAGVVAAPAGQLARVVGAYAKKGEAA